MDIETLIDTYCRAWTAPDAAERAALLQAVWHPEGRYTDPGVDLLGPQALLAHIAAAQARRPGARVLRSGAVDAHHDVARFDWQVVDAAGAVRLAGLDLLERAADGRIARIVGFFAPQP